MKSHNVRLVRYFFTESHVTAIQGHDPQLKKDGTFVHLTPHQELVAGDDGAQHAVMVRMESDMDQSENPPYSIKVEAIGFFEPASGETEELRHDYSMNVGAVSMQVLVGAIREHVAMITARSAWGEFIPAVAQIRPNDEPSDQNEDSSDH